MAEHGLLAVIVLLAVHDERQVHEIPAGEGARGLADVGLAVVADPHGEQLHDLAGEVLVRRALDVHAGVEERQHGRVPGDADQEIAEVPRPVPVEEVELQQHLAIVAHLVLIRREVAVPEERHLLFQRPVRRQHPVGPPVGGAIRLEPARPEPVEELVGDGLQPPVALRLDLHPEGLACLAGQIRRRRAARWERLQAGVMDTGMLERREMAVVGGPIVHEPAHRSVRRHAGEALDLLRRPAEAGSLEEMGSAVIAPVVRPDRRQVFRPRGRAGPAHGAFGSGEPAGVRRQSRETEGPERGQATPFHASSHRTVLPV